MRALVLGGQEFVGRAIVEALLSDGWEVSVLSRGSRPPIADTLQLRADRTSLAEMSGAVRGYYDCVVDTSGTEPEMVRVSCSIESIRNAKHYIYVSSASVYQRELSQLPFHENATGGGDPIWGTYGAAKWECEVALHDSLPGSWTILRPPYVYGPRNPDLREQFVWARVAESLPVPVPGDGSRRVQFCFVLDLARLVTQIAGSEFSGRQILNVAGSEVVTFHEWVRIAADVADSSVKIHEVYRAGLKAREYFPFRDADFYLSTSQLKQAAPETVFTPLREGLATTLAWFQINQPESLKPHLSHIET